LSGPRKTFPGESPAYRAARDELLRAESALRDRIEEVAALRRRLPDGGPVEDYVFDAAGEYDVPEPVRLSELFSHGRQSLIVYSFMFGPDEERPCASCTSVIDGLNGIAAHVLERVDLVAVARSPLPRLAQFARSRGWNRIPLLSSARNDYNRDYLAEDEQGHQLPMLNVFVRRPEGIRHFWGSELLHDTDAGDDAPRHLDLIWPLWNLLDLTPEGRGLDWNPRLSY